MTQKWDAGLYDGKHAFVWKHGEALVDLLAPQAGERILDLGCGTGHLSAKIAEAGAVVVGLDQSTEMLQQARDSYPQMEFVAGDACTFAFDQPFDAIFSNATLHWVRPPEAVIERVRAALIPGGRFVAEFGGHRNVTGVLTALQIAADRMKLTLPAATWFYPGIAEYAGMLEAAGLEVRFASLFDRPTPLEGAEGLRAWVRMFRGPALDTIPSERREDFLAAVEEAARPTLFRDGGWIADYRRLRVVAFCQA